MDSEYNFARKSFLASTKQCKCATNTTAPHIRFVVDLDHLVPIKEGSAATGAAADDDSASAWDSVPPNEKHNLPMALLRSQMIVSSPRGDMPARQLCPKVNLKIRVVDIVANLIVLESKGIDFILGMDWLGKCNTHFLQE
jgi:hypothetical protein